MATDLEPDFPTAEQLEACAKLVREGTALWVWGDDYFENVLLWMAIWRSKRGNDEEQPLDAPVHQLKEKERVIADPPTS